jgi:ABC-2 type transport system permease protein/lipopolysaccharide transport system permease protein
VSVLTRSPHAESGVGDSNDAAATRMGLGVAHRELVENLILRDVKARYKQSILGLAWAVFNPLVYAVVYTIVGQLILKQDTHIPTPVFAYFGLLYWNLFATGLGGATESLVSHISLITKVYFPREVFPISAVLAKTVDFGFGMVGILPLLIAFHVRPSLPGFLLALPLAVLLLVFTTGVGMLTACANLFYRDVRHLVALTLNLLMFLVPNMYPLDQVPERFWPLYLLNPVATIIETARRLTFPQAGDVRPLLLYVGIACLTSLALLTVGYTVFKRNEARFAEFI